MSQLLTQCWLLKQLLEGELAPEEDTSVPSRVRRVHLDFEFAEPCTDMKEPLAH